MKTVMVAAICAGLAAGPLAARAADLVLYDPAGQPVAVLVPVMEEPSILAQQVGFPVAGLFAQQDAMLRRMMSDMRTLQTATRPAVDPDAGSTIMVSSFSNGRDACSRTVTYRMRPGSTPLIHVSQTGGACGPAPLASQRANVPPAEPAAPPQTPAGTRLYRIDYRHAAGVPALHRG